MNSTTVDPEIAAKGWPAIIISLLCFSSLIGYMVYIYILIKYRQTLNNSFYRLAGSMVVSDVVNLLSYVVFSLPAMLSGESSMPDPYRVVVGYLSDGSWFWSSSHMAVIGINRLSAVCFPNHYQHLFSVKKVYIMIGCCWVYGMIMVTMMYGCECQYHFETYTWNFVCLNSSCVTISLKINQVCSASLVSLVVASYVVIFVKIRLISRKMAAAGKDVDKQQKRELQLVFQFIVIGISLSIYELMFWVVPPLMEEGKISVYAGLNAMNIFGVINSAIHPFMYIFFGSEIKKRIFATKNDDDKQSRFMTRTNVAPINN